MIWRTHSRPAGALPLLLAILAVISAFASGPANATAGRGKTGLFITSVSGIDPADGSARITGYVWFVSPHGTFDPLKDVEWFGRSSKVTEIARAQLPSGDDYTAVEVELMTDQQYDLRNYPFDRQSLNIKIESVKDATNIVLAPDVTDTRVADFVKMQGWQFDQFRFHETSISYDTKFGYRQTLPQFSRLTFVIDISRMTSALVIEKFIGFTVAFVISCLIYLLNAGDLGIRVGMATGSIFASVSNRYSLEGQIGFDDSFGLVDQISVLTFSAIGMALAISLYARRRLNRDGPVVAERLDDRLGFASVTIHLLLAIAAFWYATS